MGSLRDIPEKDKISFVERDEQGMFSAAFFAFSTLVTIKGYFDPKADKNVKKVIDQAVALCRDIEWTLSRTLEGSEIFRLNVSQGELIELSPLAWRALKGGVYYSAQGKGAFDITMGAVTSLWDFNEGIIPDRKELAKALTHVNWRNVDLLEVDGGVPEVGSEDPVALEDHAAPGNPTAPKRYFARLLDADAVVDLGGCAKGFIADELCALLRECGVAGAFVNLGGNVAVFGGKPDGKQWRIGIQSPFETGKIQGVVSLTAGSVVTSGLYERHFEKDGIDYHHILDSATGFPLETDIAGVSVVANTSSDADGYSTTLFALGSEQALSFVEETPGIEAILILKDGTTKTSQGLQGFSSL